MAFDAAEYRKQVLTPFAKRRITEVQAAIRELDQGETLPRSIDLTEFYAMQPGWSESEIAAHLTGVEDAIMKTTINASLKAASANLIGLHKRIAKNPLRTKTFWDPIFAARAEREKEKVEEFGQSAVAEFSALGVVTAATLREVARASGIDDSVPDSELARVIQGAVAVVAEVPTVTAPPQAVKDIGSELGKTSCRSVLAAIFVKQGEPTGFTLIDGFGSDDPALRLTVATVMESLAHIERLPDTDEFNAMGKVLGTVRSVARTDADLHNLVLGWFIERGKQISRGGALPLGAVNQLARTGLDRRDAARIIQSLGPAGASHGRGYLDVQSLVADGSIKDARRLYEATFAGTGNSETDEQKRALATLQATEQKLADLRSTAERAVRAGDLRVARQALNEALTMCTDDESLAAAAHSLPPDAPMRLVAATTPDGVRVALSWEPGFGSSDELHYQVVRKVGAAPANIRDGTVVASTAGTALVDPAPPVAAKLFYGVAATKGTGYSPVATAGITVIPPVTDVRVSADSSSVTLRWATHLEARAVEVTQTAPDGTVTSVPVGTQNGATAPCLQLGWRYTYLISAIYTGENGGNVRSAPVRVTGIPRGEATAVPSFSLRQRGSAEAPEIEATWTTIAGYAVEIWHYPTKPPWGFRTRVPMTAVSAGIQLAGRQSEDRGRRQGVLGQTARGLRHYVAVTRDGDDALIGQIQSFGVAPPVSNAKAERFGAEVVVSWDWPGAEFEVIVRWEGPDGAGERLTSPSIYRAEGGCRIPMGRAGGNVDVIAVAGTGDDRWMSPSMSIQVPGAGVPIPYTIEFQRRIFGPPTKVVVRLAPLDSCGTFDLVVIGMHGRYMPFDTHQGTPLLRTPVNPQNPAELIIPLPPSKGTFWVRAFSTTPGVLLVDPPASSMKVG